MTIPTPKQVLRSCRYCGGRGKNRLLHWKGLIVPAQILSLALYAAYDEKNPHWFLNVEMDERDCLLKQNF
jgi:hypothetical protein